MAIIGKCITRLEMFGDILMSSPRPHIDSNEIRPETFISTYLEKPFLSLSLSEKVANILKCKC